MAPKYTRLENERRFLVPGGGGPDVTRAPHRLIKDYYLPDSRLRLRASTDPITGTREFKLCKKYPSDDALSGPIVNVYLTSDEFALLSRLPGWFVRKRRHTLVHDGVAVSVDVFMGPLAGLVLCEVETATREEVAALAPPPWCGREVTADPFFSGVALSRLTAQQLAAALPELAA
jgi:CYTH domain-containing protein